MTGVTHESNIKTATNFMLDPRYEYSAPQFYDFCIGESAADIEAAEGWFLTAVTYDDSPHVCRMKELWYTSGVSATNLSKDIEFSCVSPKHSVDMSLKDKSQNRLQHDLNICKEGTKFHDAMDVVSSDDENIDKKDAAAVNTNFTHCNGVPHTPPRCDTTPVSVLKGKVNLEIQKVSSNTKALSMSKKKNSMGAITRYARDTVIKKLKKSICKIVSSNDAEDKEGHAHKDSLKQLVDMKDNLKGKTLTIPKEFQHYTDKRAQTRHGKDVCSTTSKVGKLASPFISLAERVLKFQIKTPERFHLASNNDQPLALIPSQKAKLKLTRPKEPEFETSHRVRPSRVKSAAELEEEMLAKLPKFKARPLNKKILEAPTLLAVPKSTPQLPQFQEFHLRTMERAMQHVCASSVCSSDSQSSSSTDARQRRKSAPESGGLTEPKAPHLETAARARPPKVKSMEEIEAEELAKIPKFKARPLNKRIFESRGDMGVFRSQKRQVTTPVEFHFATNERIHHHENPIEDQFDKLSLNSHSTEELVLQPTRPEPFHLLTEERGQLKELRLMRELLERGLAEKGSRVPKANPLPYTTDVPAVPPKPTPKECTKPEPFQLESLIRHEEELQRKAEELARLEQEEAQARIFHAQPVLIGPVFIPERSRKPLTEVQEFSLLVDSRAVERAEFDKIVTEKQNQYKRLREEFEAARKEQEERLIKALRREMIPQARPMPVFDKPFVPQRSIKEPTRPVSPKLRLLARKQRSRRSSEVRRSAERRRSFVLAAKKRSQMR